MPTNKRHIHHINPQLQNRLIISFVIFELLLISATIFILYLDMNQVIEDSMFRIHIQEAPNIIFFGLRLLQASAILLIVNFIIASFIVWFWRRYVNRIIDPLESIIDSNARLDFSARMPTDKHHEVLKLADNWLHRENTRFKSLRSCLTELDINKPDETIEKLKHAKQLIDT